ncbi:MAG: flagellar basal body P-ring formation chaperone FlgA [Terriglobia bacterium]
MRFRPWLVMCILLLAGLGQAREALHMPPAARIPLLTHVILRSNTFTLADLLPGNAPAELRWEAAKIVLGDAPQPAASRLLYCEQLQFLLRDHPSLLAVLKLPSQIALERFHRAITVQEVANAIRQALGDQGPAGKDPLDLKGLQFSTPVYVTQNDPGLEVLRIESDPLRHETRFRLWTSKEPGNLPFTVVIPHEVKLPTLVALHPLVAGEIVSATDFAVVMRPGTQSSSSPTTTASTLSGLETRAPLHAGQAVNQDQFAQPALVEPGTLATLVLKSSAFSIKTIVIPLEQGVLGQEVRVRNVESRRVVEAKVVGRDQLLKTE